MGDNSGVYMVYNMPSNLKDLAEGSNGHGSLPDHMKYKCSGLLSDVSEEITYDGKEVLTIDVYFGINDQETRERRSRDGWAPDENVSVGDAGPLLIDIAVYFIVKGEMGETVETNFYTGEPAEYISTSTYEEILRDESLSAIRSKPEVEW